MKKLVIKRLVSLSVIASSMALAACGGGSSDSSGSSSYTTAPAPTTTTTAPSPTTTNTSTPSNACAMSGSTVYATTSGCTYSSANVNSGEAITYVCTADQRIQSSIGINAKTVVLNGITIMCKP